MEFFDMNNLSDFNCELASITDECRKYIKYGKAADYIPELAKAGARLKIFDPEGRKEGEWRFEEIRDSIEFCDNEYDAIEESDAVMILTEWHVFRNLDLDRVKKISRGNFFFDFRNIYTPSEMEKRGFDYYSVGR